MIHRIVLCFFSLLLSACSYSSYEYTKTTPTIVSPVSSSTAVDISSSFRGYFCSLLAERFPENKKCSDYFYDFGSSKVEQNSQIDLNPIATQMHVLIIPGIFGECIGSEITPFKHASQNVSEKYPSVRFTLADNVNGRASSEFNSGEIRKAIESIELRPNEKLILISYSKGTADTLHYLARFHGKNSKKISAIVSLAGIVVGTPIADKAGEIGASIGGKLPLEDCPTQDESGIESLTLQSQMRWLSDNSEILNNDIPMFSLVTASEPAQTSLIFTPFHQYMMDVAGINDGQVPASHQIIPGSKLLGYLNSDHWAFILPFNQKEMEDLSAINRTIKLLANKNDFPREVLLESIVYTLRHELH